MPFPARWLGSILFYWGIGKPGKQEQVGTGDFFSTIATSLPVVEGSYMQTMVFAKAYDRFKDIDVQCEKRSAAMWCFDDQGISWFWLPTAQKWSSEFDLILKKVDLKSSGRLDYIRTNRQWREVSESLAWKKYWAFCNVAFLGTWRSQDFTFK